MGEKPVCLTAALLLGPCGTPSVLNVCQMSRFGALMAVGIWAFPAEVLRPQMRSPDFYSVRAGILQEDVENV